LAAVDLYRRLAQVELGSNLLIQQAGDDKRKDLALPWSRRIDALLRFGHCLGRWRRA